MHPFPFGVTVTVARIIRDPRTGDEIERATHTIEHCYFARGGTTERTDLGASVTTKPTLFGPYDADIRSSDEITVVGESGAWQVDGDVLRHRSPFTGWRPCSETSLIQHRGA